MAAMELEISDTAKYIILDILNEADEPVLSPKCCIYKVPEHLRKENEDAYTPHLISIGPVHHNNEKLKTMEKQKSFYFKCFRQQLSDEGKKRLEVYTTKLENEEEDIRKCYSETYSELDKQKFVRMILLDAVFIMELFLRKREGRPLIDDDQLFTKSWLRKSIQRDLLLVENQIPFLILDKLYLLVPVARQDGRYSSFLELARNYFKAYDPFPELRVAEINNQNKMKQDWHKPEHFTDLIRYFFVPQDLSHDDMTTPDITSATKLNAAGITFESVSNKCLLDVKFNWLKACLQIPRLKVDGLTESVLRNLMAFEQCHYPYHHYVCSYVALIDSLVHTEKDVDVLVENKVIVHELGSNKDLAGLINILRRNVVINSTYYGSLSKKLNTHNQNRCLWKGFRRMVGVVVLAVIVANLYKTLIV